jgi:hypothetical protein
MDYRKMERNLCRYALDANSGAEAEGTPVAIGVGA